MNPELLLIIRRNALGLGLVALVATSLLATTYIGTREQIAESQRKAQQEALLEIVPLERHDNDLLLDTMTIPAKYRQTLNLPDDARVHLARDGDRPVAIIVPSIAVDGYSGPIRLVIGIDFDGRIAGVRVIEHKETPGLGDKIELRKNNWILGFDGKSLQNPELNGWKVKKDGGDFDQFTGATITPRAIVAQVARTLQYFSEDRQRLLRRAKSKEIPRD